MYDLQKQRIVNKFHDVKIIIPRHQRAVVRDIDIGKVIGNVVGCCCHHLNSPFVSKIRGLDSSCSHLV